MARGRFVSVEVDIRGLGRGVITDREFIDDFLGSVRRTILLRTAKGRDAEGRAFVPYAGDYKKGRTPDLRVSSAMLNSIIVRPISGTRGEVLVSLRRAYPVFMNRQRPFMGVTPEEFTRLLTAAAARHQARMDADIERGNRRMDAREGRLRGGN